MSPGPAESGQGAFAAIAEIVEILRNDPQTDWARVDIAALREHLVDMNALMLHAVVDQRPVDGGLEMLVRGDGRTLRAIQAMIPAHARELDHQPGWRARAETLADGARLVVVGDEPAQSAQIRALGFFGLMATGAHHQAHHLAIASGRDAHRH